MQRDLSLDSLRGLMVLYMFSQHLIMGPMSASSWIGDYTIFAIGWAPAAGGFVTISGIVIGMAYTSLYGRKGDAAVIKASRQQAWKIYFTHMGTLAIVLIGAQFLPAMLQVDERMQLMASDPIRQFILASLLLYQPTFFDILPMYCLYLLVTPLVIRTLHTHGAKRVMLASAGLWIVMQLGGGYLMAVAVDRIRGAHMGLFNPLAWQAGYVFGLCMGYERVRSGNVVDRIPAKWMKPLLAVSVLVVLAGLYTRWFTTDDPIAWINTQLRWKAVFPPMMVVNFAGLCFLVAVLAKAYPRAFSWPPLAFVGKHPLICFAFHLVFVMYLQGFHAWVGSLSEPVRVALWFAFLTTISVPAWVEEWWQQKQARERALARAGAGPSTA